VAGGQLEAAIINRPRTRLTLRNDPMLDEEIVLVSGAKADIGKENLALKKVLGLKMVLPTKQHGLRKILDSITSSENLELSPIHEIDSINAIMQLVEISDYVTLLPQLALKGASSMKLSMNSIHSPGLTRQISCVSHPRRPLNAAVASFIEICSRFSIETHTK
jgi:DNA-binding transcriptional LysR family regulator